MKDLEKRNIYLIKPFDMNVECCFLTMDENIHVWHKRLCHVNYDHLKKLSKKNLVVGLPKRSIKHDMKCATCLKNKMVNVSHKSKYMITTKRPLELLHLDLFGPTRILSVGGRKYGLVIFDDF